MHESITSLAHVAVTPHDLATQAALATMEGGGNAVDAAIAANAVLAVVAPETCGIGGDLFALIHRPDSAKPECLNASGRAGSNATSASLRDDGHTEMPILHRATITTPGCVDGWEALRARFGTMAISELVSPALDLAENGFPVSAELARTIAGRAEELSQQPSAAPFYPDGRMAQQGETIKQPQLARTLREISDGGRDAFYGGQFGSALIEASQDRITRDDLAVNQADWVEPLGLAVFGNTAWTVPPNSQGYVTLATLAIFELLGPPSDPDDPDFQHLLIEAYKAAGFDLNDYATDPSTAPMAGFELLANHRIEDRAELIDRGQAGVWPVQRKAPGGTAYLCTIDEAGMGVSFIQSNFHGIGSGYSAGDTGVWLHNRGGGFTLERGHPNELSPGRRPLHTLAPTLWTDQDRLAMLLGTRGGHMQPQLVAQVAAALHAGGDSLEEAQARPRWSLDQPDRPIGVEPGMPAAPGLEDLGHGVVEQPGLVSAWGPVSIIRIDESGVRTAAADPRVATATARSSPAA